MFATSHQVPDQIPDRNKKSRSHYETGFRILTPFILPGLKGNGLKLFNHIKHFRYLTVNVMRCQDRKEVSGVRFRVDKNRRKAHCPGRKTQRLRIWE